MSTISGKSSRPSEVSDSSAWTKLVLQLAAALLGAEELAHGAVPVDDAEDAGELVALLELWMADSSIHSWPWLLRMICLRKPSFHRPSITSIIISRTTSSRRITVPGMPQVMVRVAAIVQRRQRQGHGAPLLAV